MTVSVTLQSSTDSQYGPGSISAFVDQLYKQRGSMRDVTDESLREQIANEGLEEGDGRGEDDASDENEGEDLDARLKRLGSAREEMLNLVG